MFFQPNTLAANSRLRGHWDELWANRNIWNRQHGAMVQQHQGILTGDLLSANNQQFVLNGNNLAGLGREFWAEIDNQVLQLRDQEIGMELVQDLMGVQTILPVGKTAKLYNVVGDIADDVQITMDGQAPYSFDHTEYDNDGDPIPVFTAGYGVNWRHAAGLNTVGVDLVLDSQRAKLRKFYKKIVKYFLDGSPKIKVNSYAGQGIRNHRNTIKINLGAGAGGVNIDLTTADAEALLSFFGQAGAFGAAARANRVDAYDVLWVSYEIWANMAQPYLINLGSGNASITGTVLQAILPFIPARTIKPTYALSGNEFLGYQRRQDVISPLVGMAVGVVPLPRPLPQTNYNFQIMSASGLQITKDAEGRSGVIYGGNLA